MDAEASAEAEIELPAGHTLIVSGSLNSKEWDRVMDRTDLRPVQVHMDGAWESIPFFQSWGRFGVSSFAWNPRQPFMWYVSTGDDLKSVDLRTAQVHDLGIKDLVDVHEMTWHGERLLVSNTGRDEFLEVDVTEGSSKSVRRVGLKAFRNRMLVREANGESARVIDRFHLNQAFHDMEGDLCCLVHHVTGEQVVREVAKRLIKSQGHGGVINIDRQERIPLDLKGPHSVRMVGEEYWIFDSGDNSLARFDRTWQEIGRIDTMGWGRGAAVAPDGTTVYGGVSATRKRYLEVIPGARQCPNMVIKLSATQDAVLGRVLVPSVEQINNVYLVPTKVAEAALSLENPVARES